jgi:hypothetical protein
MAVANNRLNRGLNRVTLWARTLGEGRMLRLKPAQEVELRDLLKSAIGDEDELDDLLNRLDRRLADLAPLNKTFGAKVKLVVVNANGRLWWRDLVREASNMVPGDRQLLEFADRVGMSAQVVDGGTPAQVPVNGRALELKIKAAQSTFDIVTWREKIPAIENCVCRIEYPEGKGRGTGFLVAPGIVLTNYHVIKQMKEGALKASDIVCRFDYKVLSNGVEVGKGRTCRLAANWLAEWSPYSNHDFESEPSLDPSDEELDFAFLRLDSRVGDDVLPNGETRNWIEVPEDAHDFTASPALYIVQHPDAKPMQIALDSEAVIKSSPTRVRYTTTTEPGSSGSPCFGADWDWVAIHHSGDPKYWSQGKKPEYNQGIPVTAIVKLLKKRGSSNLLGGG